MAFWNGHAFQSHTNETLNGNFVSPVTNELHSLTWAERAISEAILRRFWADDENPWGNPMGYTITRLLVSEWTGKKISDPLWRSAIGSLERGGIISVIREKGEGHKVTLGKLLRCDQNECQISEHYPGEYPLPKVSTPLQEVSREINFGKETPNISRDINKLNNSLIITNTPLEVSESFRYSPSSETYPGEPDPASAYKQDPLEELPENWVKWVWASAKRKGFTEPSPADIAHAQVCFASTGLDLEPNGSWQDGRPMPRPKTNNTR